MKLIAAGLNHRTASIAVRERLAIAADQLKDALKDGLATVAVTELVLLSTCNRTEIFAAVDELGQVDGQQLLEWLCSYHSEPTQLVQSHGYSLHGEAALEHIIKVAAGLDSMVLGEPQILGQMKTAYSTALEAESVAGTLHGVFQHAFGVAKQIRTETGIGANPVSVAYTAVSLSRRIFSKLSNKTALLIGAGETVELVARHLKEQGINKLIVANRSLGRARELAERVAAKPLLLSDLASHLHLADIVISSTGSQLPVLGKGAVESAIAARKHKPMFMVDIAVPRDIEPEVGSLPDVYLYTIDDLHEVVDDNLKERQAEAAKAERIVAAGVEQFRKQLNARSSAQLIVGLRQRAENLRDQEVERALVQLEKGGDPSIIIRQLGKALTNKLMHKPSVAVKQASEKQDETQLAVVKDIFGLSGDN